MWDRAAVARQAHNLEVGGSIPPPATKLIFKLNKMKDFLQRRENILGVFNKAKKDLEQLNVEIQGEIDVNKQKIQELLTANTGLYEIKDDNTRSIRVFNKLFK